MPRKTSTKKPSTFPQKFRDAQHHLQTMGKWPYEERQAQRYYVEYERLEQAILVAWAWDEARGVENIPEAWYLYAIPNGEYRDVRTVMGLAIMGVAKGIPDLCLPVPCGGFGSLYIEMKKMGNGKQSPEQKEWQATLERLGHLYQIAYTWEEGRDIITDYLDGKIVLQKTSMDSH
jgi:hypothetical protein